MASLPLATLVGDVRADAMASAGPTLARPARACAANAQGTRAAACRPAPKAKAHVAAHASLFCHKPEDR